MSTVSTVSTRRSLTDCTYAAGLSLARWYFGFPTEAIEVVTPAGYAAAAPSGPTRCEILITGSSIAPRDLPDGSNLQGAELAWQCRCGRVLAEIELVVLACGFRAPVKQRGQCGLDAWRRKRAGDYERARMLADRLAGDPALALELACVRARALLGSTLLDRALARLTRESIRHGRLERDQIHWISADHMCGLGPARAAWSQSWPPSLDQLQDAHIPYLDLDEEELMDRTYRAYQSLCATTA